MISNIIPVILCGGSGTRLWPVSGRSFPKQFSKLMGDESLFQLSVRRFSGDVFAAPLIVTCEPFRFIVAEQLASINRSARAVLSEPSGRNSGPAALAALCWLQQEADPSAIVLLSPSDHVIAPTEVFLAAVERALPVARAGGIVTFGVRPTRPETGYGYLELAGEPAKDGVGTVSRFVEKPPASDAAGMVSAGNFLWNSGLVMATVATLRDAYATHASALVDPVHRAVSEARVDLGIVRLAPEPWSAVKPISIDYAVMEHVGNLSAVSLSADWSDLGDWYAVWNEGDADNGGNVCAGNVTAIDSVGSLLRSESPNIELVGLGLEEIVAVAMPDAVLVASRNHSQRVKEVVAELKSRHVAQAEAFPVEHRPWGWYEKLVSGQRFQVKRILVHPGAALSLQSHHHRSEHWVVVEGTARVTLQDKTSLVSENESIFIPLGAVHRLENPGKMPLVLIEVQTGSYLGEDDIIRYDDAYARE